MRLAKSWIFFSVILLLFIYIIALKQSHSSTPPIKDNKGNVIPESIASLEMVELGDINQCILIRGNNLSNPILLWLHGGPDPPKCRWLIILTEHWKKILS